jgi:universal stress protein A
MKPTVVLCPVDFSESSRVAFEEACAVAVDAGARLVLLHVHGGYLLAPEMPILPAEVIQRDVTQRSRELAALERQARERGVTQVQTELIEGVAWDRIVTAARTFRAQLVVMGTHGRTGVRHVLIGSVAEKVTRHAPCSVLVVRAQTEAA